MANKCSVISIKKATNCPPLTPPPSANTPPLQINDTSFSSNEYIETQTPPTETHLVIEVVVKVVPEQEIDEDGLTLFVMVEGACPQTHMKKAKNNKE